MKKQILFILTFSFLAMFFTSEGMAAVSGSVSDFAMRDRARKLQEMRDNAWKEKMNPTKAPDLRKLAPPPQPIDNQSKEDRMGGVGGNSAGQPIHNGFKLFLLFVLSVVLWAYRSHKQQKSA